MTRVLVVGASGKTGREVMMQALHRSVGVFALSHRAFLLPPGASPRPGNVLDPTSLPSALAGVDAVLSLLGPKKGSPQDLCSRGYRNLVDAMVVAGVRRLVCVTGAMVGHPREHLHGFYRLAPKWMSAAVRASIEDRRSSERIVMDSALVWTVVRPPRLVDGGGGGVLQSGAELRIGSFSRCPRGDLARFLLDEVLGPGHPRQALAVRA